MAGNGQMLSRRLRCQVVVSPEGFITNPLSPFSAHRPHTPASPLHLGGSAIQVPPAILSTGYTELTWPHPLTAPLQHAQQPGLCAWCSVSEAAGL